ncbi:sigma-70 family RNA polymerase sigma factor [Rossellomorea aquimaris]|nr:sigma-70 family RNA polymerase sigma factor [Rossellomorea aquimaris]WRP06883.1 sigma-70 family RNA polymerase sigma factor [Rossellomorea aquimaris]
MQTLTEVNKDQIHIREKADRLHRKYGEKTRYFIIRLEEAWDVYAELHDAGEGEDAFRVIYDDVTTRFLVYKKVNEFTRKWSKKGMTREDFTSIFWTTAWQVTAEHTFRDDYYLYEKLPKALESAGIDFVRANTQTDKRKANAGATSYKEFHNEESYRFEGDVEIKILIEQYCTELEQAILFTYLECPAISYTDMGRIHGIDHSTKVKRILDKALTKMKKALMEE